MDDQCVVEMRGITKIFNGVKANDNVDFFLKEINPWFIGRKRSRKTTLMNILYGLYQQEEGEIL